MSDVVNLRRHRKQAERAEKDKSAAENRIRFGRTKVERETAEREDKRSRRMLDGHLLDSSPNPDRQR